MTRRLLAAALAAVALSACSSPADAPAAKACGLLADAQNRVNGAVSEWVAGGRAAGGSDAVRAATAAYPDRLAAASDAAPAELAAGFAEVARLAAEYNVDHSDDTGLAMTLAGEDAVRACESQGVDMQITNPRTGVVE